MRTDAFAIYHTWPDMRNAEYEVLQRVLNAAQRIGKRAVVIDNGGTVIWAHPGLKTQIGRQLSPDDVDFAISLHFESPRVCDVYTYYALWQPIEFYADFGYQESIDKFSTHNDLLSCHSDIADRHALNIFSGMQRQPVTPLPSFFHMVPEPFLEPRISDQSCLFYVGINWERIGRPKGRFHDVLTQLDAQKLVKIYGPELIQGVAPWEGFQTYSGELPFDGSSMLSAINDCGICLALSSNAHQNSGIMSNRLFEGLAGGAVVIANPNAIIDKYFKDVVYVVDDTRGDAFLHQQIMHCMRQIRADPEAARKRVLKGQQILRAFCSLEGSLQHLFDVTPMRKQNQYRNYVASSRVAVVLLALDASAEAVAAKVLEIAGQVFCTIELHVIIGADVADHLVLPPDQGGLGQTIVHAVEINIAPTTFDGLRVRPAPIGELISDILFGVDKPYFALMQMSDRIMRDHFASLVHAMEREEKSHCAVSGSLLRTVDLAGREQRKLHELRINGIDRLLKVEGQICPARMLFRGELIKDQLLPLICLLDGDAHYLFLVLAMLEGPLAQTCMATHLHDEATPVSIRSPALSSDLQRQFIRDYLNSDPRWRDSLNREDMHPTLNPTSDPLTHQRWMSLHTHANGLKRIELNRRLPVKTGGAGLKYLAAGFSSPEQEAVWLASDKGVIEFSLPNAVAKHAEDYNIVLGIHGRRCELTGRMQHCTFVVNNIAVAYHAVPDFFTNVSVRIPLNVMRGSNHVRLELIPDHSQQVHDSSGSLIDERQLSLMINSIAVMRDTLDAVQPLSSNTTYKLNEGEAAVRALVVGFYAPERNGTWLCGLAGEIQFRVADPVREPVLHLRMKGRRANHSNMPQIATVCVNGQELGRVSLDDEVQTYQFSLPAAEANDIITIILRCAHAEPVLDGAGSIIDPRFLGVALYEIGFFEKTEIRLKHRGAINSLFALSRKLQAIWKGD